MQTAAVDQLTRLLNQMSPASDCKGIKPLKRDDLIRFIQQRETGEQWFTKNSLNSYILTRLTDKPTQKRDLFDFQEIAFADTQELAAIEGTYEVVSPGINPDSYLELI